MGENIQNTYRFCNLKSHRELTDVLEMHFVELPKFQGNKPSHLRSRFEKWLHVLKFGELYADWSEFYSDLLRASGSMVEVLDQVFRYCEQKYPGRFDIPEAIWLPSKIPIS